MQLGYVDAVVMSEVLRNLGVVAARAIRNLAHDRNPYSLLNTVPQRI
jgi:hypothetical protein